MKINAALLAIFLMLSIGGVLMVATASLIFCFPLLVIGMIFIFASIPIFAVWTWRMLSWIG